jgi:hypothetical protein
MTHTTFRRSGASGCAHGPPLQLVDARHSDVSTGTFAECSMIVQRPSSNHSANPLLSRLRQGFYGASPWRGPR